MMIITPCSEDALDAAGSSDWRLRLLAAFMQCCTGVVCSRCKQTGYRDSEGKAGREERGVQTSLLFHRNVLVISAYPRDSTIIQVS